MTIIKKLKSAGKGKGLKVYFTLDECELHNLKEGKKVEIKTIFLERKK